MVHNFTSKHTTGENVAAVEQPPATSKNLGLNTFVWPCAGWFFLILINTICWPHLFVVVWERSMFVIVFRAASVSARENQNLESDRTAWFIPRRGPKMTLSIFTLKRTWSSNKKTANILGNLFLEEKELKCVPGIHFYEVWAFSRKTLLDLGSGWLLVTFLICFVDILLLGVLFNIWPVGFDNNRNACMG